jgi:hypothetical protein
VTTSYRYRVEFTTDHGIGNVSVDLDYPIRDKADEQRVADAIADAARSRGHSVRSLAITGFRPLT